MFFKDSIKFLLTDKPKKTASTFNIHCIHYFVSVLVLPTIQEDNGVKLIDPLGEMLSPTWEGYATLVANAEEGDLVDALKEVIAKEEIEMSQKASVFVGRDTRYVHKVQSHFIVNPTINGNISILTVCHLATHIMRHKGKQMFKTKV